MKRSYKSLFILKTLMAGCVILLAGCGKIEPSVPSNGPSNGPIRLNVNTVGATRSVAMTETSLRSEGFVLDVITDDEWTKVDEDGTPVGTMHSAGPYVTSDGKANVRYSSTSHSYTPADPEGLRPDADATEYWYIYDTDYEIYNWINGIKLRFWARYPQDSDADISITTAPAPTKDYIIFKYDLPDPSAASPFADATNQKDILFAYNERVKQKEDDIDDIDIAFNHPLSEIRFCVSPDDGTFDVNLQIESITITNVPVGGNCQFNGKGKIKPGTGEKAMFVWTPSTTLGSYSQTYNAQFDDASAVDPDEWAISGYGTEGKHVYTCQNAFMLIPHTPKYVSGGTTNAQIKIKFIDTVTSEVIEKTSDLNKDGHVWKPGHYFTYKIIATKVGRSISSYVILTDWADHDSKINVPC